MGGCCGDENQKFYMVTAPGVAKIVAVVVGSAPVILAFILYDFYTHHPRPNSELGIIIHKRQREAWELAFLIVVAASLGVTVLNLLFYTCFKCLSTNVWTRRVDCGYLTVGGTAQAIVGFIMVASALTSGDVEPVALKYAAGFLGIATGIFYWGAATLANRD